MTELSKDKRRADRRKRNVLAHKMRMNKVFHEKVVLEKDVKDEDRCPWCPRNQCTALDPDDCYYA